ncbi:tumor necrosis factor receptor superfamily member 10A-like isoform X2 [Apteryx mantelli]|uniref:Tumor necrosis factor receptor superfamily member 10A-like isoform X2 n=1 Tax=Apteryx mantelli TaxID=2696672 RepID=A0ABM4FUG4_9AVES
MRDAPRRRCLLLPLLLLLPEAFWGTVAVALDRRDNLDHLDLSRGREDFYQVQDGDHYCKKCPAGTYVAEPCKVQNGSSKCLPCKEDEYIEYPNDFSKCLGCRTCREENMIVIIVVVLFVVALLAICLWKCCCSHCSHGGDGRDLRRKSSSVVDCIMLRLRRCAWGGLGMQDNIRNEQVIRDQQQELLSTGPDSVVPGAPALDAMPMCPGVNVRRKLVPVQGEDPVILLRRSFDIFAREVPYKDWKRYGRALDLLENDIALAEMNDRYSLEPFFQMLNTWQNRQGMKASVNMLLETLDRIDLGGVAGDISFRLIQQGFYQYEEVS